MIWNRQERPFVGSVLSSILFGLASCKAPEAMAPPQAAAPVAPAPAQTPAPAPAAPTAAEEEFRKLLAGMGVQYFAGEKHLEISGWINMQKGLIEVFACAPEGKTHEALIVLDCLPSGAHAGLLALGLKAGTPVETGTEADYKAPAGDPVIVEVAWKTATGEERRVRAEDLIWDESKKASMPHVAWLFTGSFTQSVTGDPKDATYAADFVKSIITTYHDPSTVIENPLPDGRDDTLFYVHEERTPPVGTPVKVLLRRG